MCGLGGEFRLDGRAADPDAVARMSASLSPRGPDGSGSWASGPLALVHHRLKVIDLSDAGAQPMVNDELRLVTVFNGCIYNHRQLRAELETHGYRFRSQSDTEVIAAAYHRWGRHCVEHFLGMFAFAVYEMDSHRLVLARDRLGIKPLYLAQTPGRLRFASTLPALLAAGDVDTSVDPVALHHYLSWHAVVPPPRTILAGVTKLPAATVRTIEADGRSSDWAYWEPPATRPGPDDRRADWSGNDWRDAVLAALRTAVARRIVADVPVGVLLSGGLDSSLIVALLAEGGQRDLATFSIGFGDSGGESGNEYEFSDLVAREFATVHQQIHIEDSRLVDGLDGAIAAMSEPMVSHDCVAFYLLSQEVAPHVRVVQTGQGADEVFAGYDWYPPLAGVPRDQAVAAYSRVFVDRTHDEIAALVQPHWLAGGQEVSPRLARGGGALPGMSRRNLLQADPSGAFVRDHLGSPGAETTLDAALRLDTRVMLADDPVKRVDTMTMAFGLEARVPFLDHELVELAMRCPPELKLAGGGKGVLKAAARGIVPDAVIDRPKGYFPVPGVRHLDGPVLDRVRDALTAPAARERGLFRPDVVAGLLAEPNARRTTIGGNVAWQVGLLELWLQRMGV